MNATSGKQANMSAKSVKNNLWLLKEGIVIKESRMRS